MELIYKNETIKFTIEYKKRKTIQIKIDPAGRVTVNAPKDSDEAKIVKCVEQKSDWILKEQKKLWKTDEADDLRGEQKKYLYLGKYYDCEIVESDENAQDHIVFNGERFIMQTDDTNNLSIESLMGKFYQKECRKIIKKRVSVYQKYFKVKPKIVSIEDSIKRWGCCNTDREMHFHWRLIMAPIEVIDYVVVHEMCHLIHMNHSKSFWTLVGKVLPDYKEKMEWLQYNGHKMNL